MRKLNDGNKSGILLLIVIIAVLSILILRDWNVTSIILFVYVMVNSIFSIKKK